MIYLDHAATSLEKPQAVSAAVARAMRSMASPGRGGHAPAMLAAETVYRCREEAVALFHMQRPENVVFTMNATHALNLAIHSLGQPHDRVVISGFEHNSVTRPLHALEAEIRVAGRRLFDPEDTLADFRRLLPGAKFAVCTAVSNVFGYILPVREIAALCSREGVPLILDVSQALYCLLLLIGNCIFFRRSENFCSAEELRKFLQGFTDIGGNTGFFKDFTYTEEIFTGDELPD